MFKFFPLSLWLVRLCNAATQCLTCTQEEDSYFSSEAEIFQSTMADSAVPGPTVKKSVEVAGAPHLRADRKQRAGGSRSHPRNPTQDSWTRGSPGRALPSKAGRHEQAMKD
jgi:hypothetical protein